MKKHQPPEPVAPAASIRPARVALRPGQLAKDNPRLRGQRELGELVNASARARSGGLDQRQRELAVLNAEQALRDEEERKKKRPPTDTRKRR
jgi:hypothetical protein